jgi:hypothetical protein
VLVVELMELVELESDSKDESKLEERRAMHGEKQQNSMKNLSKLQSVFIVRLKKVILKIRVDRSMTHC